MVMLCRIMPIIKDELIFPPEACNRTTTIHKLRNSAPALAMGWVRTVSARFQALIFPCHSRRFDRVVASYDITSKPFWLG